MPWYGAWRRRARNARARPVLAAGSPRSSGPHAYRIRDGAQISARKQYLDNRRVGAREPAIRLIVDKHDGQFLGVACLPYVVLRKVRKILALCNSQGSMRRRSDNAKVGVAGRAAIRGHGIPEVDLSFPPADTPLMRGCAAPVTAPVPHASSARTLTTARRLTQSAAMFDPRRHGGVSLLHTVPRPANRTLQAGAGEISQARGRRFETAC